MYKHCSYSFLSTEGITASKNVAIVPRVATWTRAAGSSATTPARCSPFLQRVGCPRILTGSGTCRSWVWFADFQSFGRVKLCIGHTGPHPNWHHKLQHHLWSSLCKILSWKQHDTGPSPALPVFTTAPAIWAFATSHACEAEQEPSPHPALLSLDLRGAGRGGVLMGHFLLETDWEIIWLVVCNHGFYLVNSGSIVVNNG